MWIKKTREENVQTYLANCHVILNNEKLQRYIVASKQQSKIYDYPLRVIRKQELCIKPNISVINESSLNAAMKFENATILNFASAVRPGGGYIKGSNAQEECLCRSSGLYEVISTFTSFYEDNIKNDSNIYLDTIIYSPSVPFFRNDYGKLMLSDNEEPRFFDVITGAMPNLNSRSDEARSTKFRKNVDELAEIYRRRISLVLNSASLHGTKNLILGAWGCGVFRNDPDLVSKIFAEELQNGFGFENVVFAILDNHEEKLIKAFRNNLK